MAATAGTTLWPAPPAARAAGSTYLPRYWLNIRCDGGLCALSSVDPYPAPARSYDKNAILTYGAFNVSPFIGNTSSYPDPLTGMADGTDYTDRFFAKYQHRLLVVKGVNNQSGDHPTASAYAATGGLALPYPDFTALSAAVLYPSLPMAYCGSNTRGIIGGSQANMGALRASSGPLLRMASPNTPSPANANDLYQPNGAWKDMLGAIDDRLARLQGLDKIAFRAQQRSLMQVARANNDNAALVNVLNQLLSGPVNPNDAAATIDVLIGCFRAGLAQGATIDVPSGALGAQFTNFDSHSNSDARQYPLIDALYRIIDYAVSSADAAGLPLNVFTTSEFSRTAGFNVNNGTDHNPSASCYWFIGPDFKGGRVVGATTIDPKYGYVGLPVNPSTLQEDPNGIQMIGAHIHAALRHTAGIETAPLAARFPVAQPVLPLFLG